MHSRKFESEKKKVKPISPSIATLINERNTLSTAHGNQNKIELIEKEIADKVALENRNIILKNFKQLSDNCENVNLQKLWKLMKNLWPKNISVIPTAKRNHRGEVVSGPTEIKNVLSKEYKERLRLRPFRPDLKHFMGMKKTIFKMKMKLA